MTLTSVQLSQLKTEYATDPKTLGYAAAWTNGSDQVLADLINTVGASGETVSAGVIDAYQVINATVPSEWAALTSQEKQRYQTLTGTGRMDTSNANLQAAFQAMFAAGTTTRANLQALLTRSASRAEVLFGAGVAILAADVAAARKA